MTRKQAALLCFLTALFVLWVAMSGCASMTGPDKLYWTGAAMDVAGSVAALECGREANPLMTAFGGSRGSVAASQVVVKGLVWWAFRDRPKVLSAMGGIQAGVAGHNLSVAGGC